MYKLKEQHGYTLVITLALLLLFSILGIGLMSLNSSGVKKNTQREGITQSHNLAVKGQELFVLSLNQAVEEKLGPGVTLDEFQVILTNTLQEYICPTTHYSTWPEDKFSVENETGLFYYCISTLPENTFNSDGSENPYKKEVVVNSIGVSTANNETTLTSAFKIGIDYHEFDYSLSTHPKSGEETNDLNGSLLFFGAVESNGNMNVANKLITSNRIQYKNYSAETLYPTLINSQTGEVLVDLQLETYQSTTNLDKLLETGIHANAVQDNLNNIIDESSDKVIFANTPKFLDAPINIQAALKKMQTTKDDNDIEKLELGVVGNTQLGTKLFSLTNVQTTKEHVYLVPNADFSKKHDNSFRVFGHLNKFNNVSFYKDLELRYALNVNGTVNQLGTIALQVNNAYIANDLNIGFLDREAATAINDLKISALFEGTDFYQNISTFDSFAHKSSIDLNGTYYVENDVRIVNAHLTGDATIYAGGDVTILFSELGTTDNNPDQKLNLNIIANGDIKMRYVSFNNAPKVTVKTKGALSGNIINVREQDYDTSFSNLIIKNNRSEINGLLYSNKTIDINSPTSYLTINGAIHSNTLILQSLRGRSIPAANTHTGNCNTRLTAGDKSFDLLRNATIDANAHCFTKKSIQKMDSYTYSYSLTESNLIEYTFPITPRLIINYSEDHAKNLPLSAKIIKLDPPERISLD